ncbi:Hypothetical predicted protein, partial [Podarcis lilfordi]
MHMAANEHALCRYGRGGASRCVTGGQDIRKVKIVSKFKPVFSCHFLSCSQFTDIYYKE